MIKTSPSRKHNWTSNHAIISRWRFFFEYIVFYLLDIIETISSSCFNQHKIRVKTTYPRYEAKENTIYEGTLIELRFSVFDGNSFASKSTISLSLSLSSNLSTFPLSPVIRFQKVELHITKVPLFSNYIIYNYSRSSLFKNR